MHHLLDVEVDLLSRLRLDLVLQLLDLRPLPADDDPGAGGMNADPRPVRRPIDVDLGDPRVKERVLDVAAGLHVLVQKTGVILRGKPSGAPRPCRPEPEPYRVGFLSHNSASRLSVISVQLPARGFR